MLAGTLKPKGIFLASIPNVSHWQVSFALFFRGRWEYQQAGVLDRTHLRFFTEGTARALFESSGCIIEKLAYVKTYPDVLSVIGNNARWRWYNRRLLDLILPARFTNIQFLIRACKVD